MPDIYELYCIGKNNENNIEKYSYASIPNIATSKLISKLYDDYLTQLRKTNTSDDDLITRYSKNNVLYVECTYHKIFKKWVPLKKSNKVDTIDTINSCQNNLNT